MARGGFRNDGSFYYKNSKNGSLDRKSSVKEIQDHVRARQKQGYFIGSVVNKRAIRDLHSFIQFCRRHSINLIVYLPPLDGIFQKLIQNHPEAVEFWSKFPAIIASICQLYDIPFHDFTNRELLQSWLPKMKPWHASGEAVQIAVLLEMSKDEASRSILEQYVNLRELNLDLKRSISYDVVY